MAERKDKRVVRLKEPTYQRLLTFMATLAKSELQEFKAGSGELPGRITCDDAIAVLLDRQEAHKARSAKSSAKRKQAEVDMVDKVDNGDV